MPRMTLKGHFRGYAIPFFSINLVDDVDMTNNDAQETLPSLFGVPLF